MALQIEPATGSGLTRGTEPTRFGFSPVGNQAYTAEQGYHRLAQSETPS
jgi:hypothetical protein